MVDSVIIKSANSNNEVILSIPENFQLKKGSEYFYVTVKSNELQASAKVYAYHPYAKVTSFFDDLSTHWKGWEGVKEWASLEGEISFKCEWEKTGYTKIEVKLLSGYSSHDWFVKLIIFLEPIQVDELASNARSFFSKYYNSSFR